MPKQKFTDDQLDGLTDEEREGLLDETLVDDPEDLPEGVENAGDGDSDGGEAGDKDGDDGNAGDDDDDDDTGDNAGAGVDSDASASEAGPDLSAAADEIQLDSRKAHWLELDSLQERKAAFNDQLKELAIKFDNGDLTAEELHEQRTAIEAERDPITTQLMRAEIGKADAIDKWKNEAVPAFFAKNTIYAEKGSILNQMLDAEVRKIQSTAANPTDPKILDLAHQRITAQIEQATGKKPAVNSNTTRKRSPKPEIPPSLGRVPAADATEPVDGSGYASLDKLQLQDTMAYEDALGRLTPAQLDHYLSR